MATTSRTSTPLSTAFYEVLKPLRRDGDSYAPGESVSLDEDLAAELRALGVVGQPTLAADPAPAPNASANK